MNDQVTNPDVDEKNKIELITVYKGKDFATYILAEFKKDPRKAIPIKQGIHPTTQDSPFNNLNMEDVDGFQISKETGWDKESLKKLIESEDL